MSSLMLGVVGTRKRYEGGSKRISWSKFSDYSLCPRKWFLTHYADLRVKGVTKEGTFSLPGILIQRVFEVYFNHRKYVNVGGSMAGSLEWMGSQVSALYDFLVFDVGVQDLVPSDTRGFFAKTSYGVDRSYEVRRVGVLAEEFYVGAEPVFIDLVKFEARWGSVEGFKGYVIGCLERSLRMFRGLGIPFSKILSEVSVSVGLFSGYEITGSIDFLVNSGDMKRGVFFQDLRDLRDDFLVWDGKLNVSSWVDSRQLYFYAYLLYLKYRKSPKGVSFIDWTKGELCGVELGEDLGALCDVKDDLRGMVEGSYRLGNFLAKYNPRGSVVGIDDIPVVASPSMDSCRFCPFRGECDVACGVAGNTLDLEV